MTLARPGLALDQDGGKTAALDPAGEQPCDRGADGLDPRAFPEQLGQWDHASLRILRPVTPFHEWVGPHPPPLAAPGAGVRGPSPGVDSPHYQAIRRGLEADQLVAESGRALRDLSRFPGPVRPDPAARAGVRPRLPQRRLGHWRNRVRHWSTTQLAAMDTSLSSCVYRTRAVASALLLIAMCRVSAAHVRTRRCAHAPGSGR